MTPEYRIQGLVFFSPSHKKKKKKRKKREIRIKNSSQKTRKGSYPVHLIHYPTSSKACLGMECKKKDKYEVVLSLVHLG